MSVLQKCNRELMFLKKIGAGQYVINRLPRIIFARILKRRQGPDRKHEILKTFQERFDLRTLVETGTYLGETVHALKNSFQKIYSIELDHDLYKNAKARFANDARIKIYEGDSGEILPQIMREMSEPCLLWLDAHYSEGITARGVIDTPIAKELEAVFNHPIKNHVILIDDARYFNGTDGYLGIPELEKYVYAKSREHKMEVAKDIIRIYPNYA